MKARKTPMRMCVGCREMKDKRELIRIVRSPEGTVSLDPVGKKPGRGAYVCPRGECLRRAIKQRQLERQLDITLSDEVTGTVSGQNAMRQATKNILYMTANSDAPTLYKAHMTTIGTILLGIFIVLMLLFVQYYIRWFLRLAKFKKGEPLQ